MQQPAVQHQWFGRINVVTLQRAELQNMLAGPINQAELAFDQYC